MIDDTIPLLCTLLFGFSGLFFVSVAVGDPAQLGTLAIRYLSWSIQRRNAILVLSGLSSAAFFASVISAIYAKLSDADASRPTVEGRLRTRQQKDSDDQALVKFRARQAKFRQISITSFNAGIFLTPICGLLLLSPLLFQIGIALYIILSIVLFSKTR